MVIWLLQTSDKILSKETTLDSRPFYTQLDAIKSKLQ